MREIKILYIHGYLGQGNGSSSVSIKNALDKKGIRYVLYAPEFPVTEPEKMFEMLEGLKKDYDYLVASSLGAFYTMQTFGNYKILVNPALPENLKAIKNQDPENNPKLTDSFLDKLEKYIDEFLNGWAFSFDDEPKFYTYLIYGTRDNIAGNETFFSKYFNRDSHIFHVDMEHKLDDTGAEKVVDIIEMLEKEKPEYIDTMDFNFGLD